MYEKTPDTANRTAVFAISGVLFYSVKLSINYFLSLWIAFTISTTGTIMAATAAARRN